MTTEFKALPVERDQYGYWTHPDYFKPADGREYGLAGEFDAWLEEKGLELREEWRDEDEIEQHGDDYDISSWQPSGIKGDGWFVGSIHDTEEGAVCIWLRHAGGAA